MKTTVRVSALLLAALTVLFCFTACLRGNDNPWDDAVYTEDTTFGEGEHTLTITVTLDEHTVVFTILTDADNVKDALLEHDLIDGEQQAVGYMMSTINGIRADYTKDGAYWGFYQNGEYMMTGIDSTPIDGDAAYEFVYTRA
jgi:hypothetical protein